MHDGNPAVAGTVGSDPQSTDREIFTTASCNANQASHAASISGIQRAVVFLKTLQAKRPRG